MTKRPNKFQSIGILKSDHKKILCRAKKQGKKVYCVVSDMLEHMQSQTEKKEVVE